MDNYNIRRPNQYTGLDMYNMAKQNHVGGWQYWPFPFLAKKHFDLIEEKLAYNEEPVFCFLARVDKDIFDNLGATNMNNRQNDPNQTPTNYKKHPWYNNMLTLFLGHLITPFNVARQMWCAFVLTNNSKLYYAHYKFPISFGSDFASMQCIKGDLQINQNNFNLNPGFGELTFESLRGQHELTILGRRRVLDIIYRGVENSIQRLNKKYEDEDGNTMY